MWLSKAERERRDTLFAKGLKLCPKCGEELPLRAFSKANDSSTGLRCWCKACGQRDYQERKRAILATKRAYYATRREEILASRLAYDESHRQENQARNRAYRQTARGKARIRAYWHTERGKSINRAKAHRRRAREAGLLATLSNEDWQDALEWFGHRCAYCGIEDVPLEQEHVVPVTKGGGYVAGNIVPACASCNGSKRAAGLEDWATGRGAALVRAGAIERMRAYRLGLLGEA